jgi:hypothetical protein
MRQGYAYYVYTTMDTGYDPMRAYGVLRTSRPGRAERLVDGKWEYDPEGYGDIIGITGATGVKRVDEAKLREIIKGNSKTLDPDEVLAP